MTQANPSDYWFSPSALYIQLNAVGDPNYIHANCSAGSMVMCYVRGISDLGYDNAHNYRRWPIIAAPTVFHDDEPRYVFIAIPKSNAADAKAKVVFPSEIIDIYGKNADNEQIGSLDYYYINTQGAISASRVNGEQCNRTWTHDIDCGKLASDEAIASGGEGSWWEWNAATDMVKFLKTISEAEFQRIKASLIDTDQLIVKNNIINMVADPDGAMPTPNDASDAIVTPKYGKANYLSRLADDIAHGRITFEQGVSLMGVNTVDGVLQSPDFVSGLYGGMGVGLDTATGTMELNRIRVREALEVIELLVNRLQAVDGDAVYSESDTIERIEAGADGTYDLYVKSKWDGYFTAFTAGAVVKGIYNSLVKQVLSGGSGNGTETSASYVTSWMRVNNVYPAQNRINVSIYDADDCPSGVNNAPIEDMVIVRWGHQSDATRQSTICISATDRRITMMQGVDSPKLTKANYGVAIGKAPEFLREKYPFLRDSDNVVYAKYLFYDSFFQTDFSGTHTITYREHTSWDADTEYWCDRQVTDENAPDFGTWYTDRVWCDGCLWQCTEDGCRTRPKWNNPDWVLLQGRNDLRVEFDVPEGFYDPDNFHAEFNVSVWLGDRNVTADILPADYEWARVSYDREGNERHQSDAVWTQQFAASSRGGNHVELDYADLSVDSVGGFPSKMVLVCRVTLLDGRTAEQEISIY